MMTRNDMEILARHLAENYPRHEWKLIAGYEAAIDAICAAAKATNARFDETKFRSAIEQDL